MPLLLNLFYGSGITLWVAFVVLVLARFTYKRALIHGYTDSSAIYFSRKIIHIFGAGIITIILPFLFNEPYIPVALAFTLSIMLYLGRKGGIQFKWFQDKENFYEIDFLAMWGISILGLWFLDNSFWPAMIPALFISFGDGVTGIVRNLKRKKRAKGWEGSIAMLLVTIPVGLTLGLAGISSAIICTLTERQSFIDDNVAVTAVAVAIILISHFFFPQYMNNLL